MSNAGGMTLEQRAIAEIAQAIFGVSGPDRIRATRPACAALLDMQHAERAASHTPQALRGKNYEALTNAQVDLRPVA
jgi:hypothetical protein